ncbi:MAG: hypothetical protein JZU55_09650 [Afipia sp.]|nr:hypothetical protein [Afipia sp.]
MKLKLAVIGLAALGSAALASGNASAMPNGLPVATDAVKNVEHIRWVCNPWGRCWWRPNYYGAYGYYGGPRFYGGPRYYGRGWGYRGGWRGRHW